MRRVDGLVLSQPHSRFAKYEPQYCDLALPKERVCSRKNFALFCLRSLISKQREPFVSCKMIFCRNCFLSLLVMFRNWGLLNFVFVVVLPSYLLQCLEVFTNHWGVAISDGFGEVHSMLISMSCLHPIAAMGSHQSGRGTNSFPSPSPCKFAEWVSPYFSLAFFPSAFVLLCLWNTQEIVL